MTKDIIVAICFVVVVLVMCKLWSIVMMKQYEKMKAVNISRGNLKYETAFTNLDKLELLGVENDENSDSQFIQAVKKIELSEDVRIKRYE